MRTRLLLIVLLASLSACSSVQIPNIRVCAVAGIVAAGADCVYTLSDKSEEMDTQQFIEFLEPTAEKGPALCQSTEDFMKLKITLEQACEMLGRHCSKETREEIRQVSERIQRLRVRKSVIKSSTYMDRSRFF